MAPLPNLLKRHGNDDHAHTRQIPKNDQAGAFCRKSSVSVRGGGAEAVSATAGEKDP